MCIAFYFILRQLQGAKRTPFSDTRRFPSYQTHEEKSILQPRRKIRSQLGDPLSGSRQTVRNPPHPIRQKAPETVRVMFVGAQVDTVSCKGADSVCCPLSCVFSSVSIMREAGEIPRLRAAQCAAAPRPAPSRCPPCRCRGTRCGCSGGSCGSISPSARPPRSAG